MDDRAVVATGFESGVFICDRCGVAYGLGTLQTTDRLGALPCPRCDRITSADQPSEPALESDQEPIPCWERLEPGERVAGCIIEDLIAEGGAGAVYAATDLAHGRRVAIKVLRQSLARIPEMQRRFLQEGRLIAGLVHDHVVRIHAHGELDDGRPYLVMELLEGPSLRQRLDSGGAITTQEAFVMFRQLCSALMSVHARSIVHRDLKPENLILTAEGERLHIKLIDFGVAKVLRIGGSMSGMTTGQGRWLGSPAYMAPEQVQGYPVDHRTDIYALGLILFEVFTDEWPWDVPRGDLWWQLKAHAELVPPPNQRLARRCPPLEGLIMRCLDKSRARRPQSMDEVSGALDACEDLWPLPYVGNPDIYRKLCP